MLEMDLFTVDDLSALITAMKVSGKQTITMADVASHLGRLKSKRTVRASSSSKHVVIPGEDNEFDFRIEQKKYMRNLKFPLLLLHLIPEVLANSSISWSHSS